MFWTLQLQVLPHVLSASLPIPRRSPSLLLFPNWMRIGCGGSVTILSPTFYWLVFMPRFALFYPLMMMMTLRLLAPLTPSIRFYASLTVYTATPLAPPSIPNFIIFHVDPGYRTLSLVGVVGCRNFIWRVILFPSGTSSKSFWISYQLLYRSRFCVSSTWTRLTIYPLQISSSSSRSLMKFSTSTACIRGRILPLPPSVSLLLVPLSLQYPCRRHLFYPLRPLPRSPLLGLLVLH